jgi:hypothetical protein
LFLSYRINSQIFARSLAWQKFAPQSLGANVHRKAAFTLAFLISLPLRFA